MSTISSDELRERVRQARISTAMRGLNPEIVTTLPPADWPDVLARLQAVYRRVTGDPTAVLSLRESHPIEDGEGWQDISTAPKDGTDVLCYGVYYAQPVRFVAHWNGIQWYAGWGYTIQPTMWQPLPSNPGTSKVENSRST